MIARREGKDIDKYKESLENVKEFKSVIEVPEFVGRYKDMFDEYRLNKTAIFYPLLFMIRRYAIIITVTHMLEHQVW